MNGSQGIAVGIATKIPPHNLVEVVEGLKALISNPDISDEELMSYVPAPDFPTGERGREGGGGLRGGGRGEQRRARGRGEGGRTRDGDVGEAMGCGREGWWWKVKDNDRMQEVNHATTHAISQTYVMRSLLCGNNDLAPEEGA